MERRGREVTRRPQREHAEERRAERARRRQLADNGRAGRGRTKQGGAVAGRKRTREGTTGGWSSGQIRAELSSRS
eukprot:scaffold29945_cov21-Phaeocystis_antarctica.AAC.1